MKKLNAVTGAIFSLVALITLLLRDDWLQAGTWLLLGLGFLLSDLQYSAAGQTGTATTSVLPPARKYVSMFLVAAAIALMSYQIGRALYQATH